MRYAGTIRRILKTSDKIEYIEILDELKWGIIIYQFHTNSLECTKVCEAICRQEQKAFRREI